MIQAKIDYLVLGCSHYPYLLPILKTILPEHVEIIDSGEAVALQTKTVLNNNNLLNTENQETKNTFYTNGDPEVLKTLIGKKFKIELL